MKHLLMKWKENGTEPHAYIKNCLENWFVFYNSSNSQSPYRETRLNHPIYYWCFFSKGVLANQGIYLLFRRCKWPQVKFPSISIILMYVFTCCLFVSLMIMSVKVCLFNWEPGKSLNIVRAWIGERNASLQLL